MNGDMYRWTIHGRWFINLVNSSQDCLRPHTGTRWGNRDKLWEQVAGLKRISYTLNYSPGMLSQATSGDKLQGQGGIVDNANNQDNTWVCPDDIGRMGYTSGHGL